MQKAFKCWESYVKRISTERQIVQRFRQFYSRLLLTKCFLSWAELSRLGLSPVKEQSLIPS